VTTAGPCGDGGATIEVEVESSRCRDVDEKKKSWEGPMPTISLSLISFDECIEKSYNVDALKALKKKVRQRRKI
jgi:hypothetical protein